MREIDTYGKPLKSNFDRSMELISRMQSNTDHEAKLEL